MAEYLNAWLKYRVALRKISSGSFLFAFSALSLASAETLPDPTRPPASLGQNFGPSEDLSKPQLQSILISPTRRIAIISGKALKTGDKVGDAQLVTISENEVVLRSGKELKVLKLYPSLRKQVSIGNVDGSVDSQSKGR